MKRNPSFLLLLLGLQAQAQTEISTLPIWTVKPERAKIDWLLSAPKQQAELYRDASNKTITIDNGLLKRSFRIAPNLACIEFLNQTNGEQMLRAVSPEARITINGTIYNVGGLFGQLEKGYFKSDWIDGLKINRNDFFFHHLEVSALKPYINWKTVKMGWSLNISPAKGKMVSFVFTSANQLLKGIKVTVNYEVYNGLPLICKWISVKNDSGQKITLEHIVNEILATPEEESSVVGSTAEMKKPHGLYVESNYAFNNSMNARLSDQTTNWKADSTYKSQVSYELQTPCLLELHPAMGPGIELLPGQAYTSIRSNELLLDNYDRERNGLDQKIMYKTIAPWATQNPIFMHLISIDPKTVKTAVDQCAETGYEGIILSFGSGLDMEDISECNISRFKALADYAHSKNILLGCYSLFSSRQINDQEDVIDPKTGKADVAARFGHAPCLGSRWGLDYLRKIKTFLKETGMDIFENDGPYAGDLCASTAHPGHKGLNDSQWMQMELQKGLYRWCAENGIYVNAPDWYFLDGTNKISIGYRESNFSLSREQQIMLNRQNIYDGTWEKLPSMCWGFVPLTEYQGGGPTATLEPLSEHLQAYEQLMMQYYGAGVQACYRGPRLYDTEKTKALVIRVISWYKKYRRILNSPLIHLRRPDGRDWDGILHVDPAGKEKGLAMLYNPTNQPLSREIKLPMYYTSLNTTAKIREEEGAAKRYTIDWDHFVFFKVVIPANSYKWLVIEK